MVLVATLPCKPHTWVPPAKKLTSEKALLSCHFKGLAPKTGRSTPLFGYVNRLTLHQRNRVKQPLGLTSNRHGFLSQHWPGNLVVTIFRVVKSNLLKKIPSGKRLQGKITMLLLGKLIISMARFNSYLKLLEGNYKDGWFSIWWIIGLVSGTINTGTPHGLPLNQSNWIHILTRLRININH